MRRFRKEFGLKKARILRERLIPVSQRLKIGINRHPLPIKRMKCQRFFHCSLAFAKSMISFTVPSNPNVLLLTQRS